jgi:hypothetical protein
MYNGYTAVLQDGPVNYIETESKDRYGGSLISADHVVWTHEIKPELASEIEALAGQVVTISVDGEYDVSLAEARTWEEERARERGRGSSR